MTEYSEMTKSQIMEEEYDGSEHWECPDCGEMVCMNPCPYCDWDREDDE